jgi:hypothetical protein
MEKVKTDREGGQIEPICRISVPNQMNFNNDKKIYMIGRHWSRMGNFVIDEIQECLPSCTIIHGYRLEKPTKDIIDFWNL